jgi:hypothetical protein
VLGCFQWAPLFLKVSPWLCCSPLWAISRFIIGNKAQSIIGLPICPITKVVIPLVSAHSKATEIFQSSASYGGCKVCTWYIGLPITKVAIPLVFAQLSLVLFVWSVFVEKLPRYSHPPHCCGLVKPNIS